MRNIIDFYVTDGEFKRNPYRLYEKLHAENAVLRDLNFNAFLFGYYEDVYRILISSRLPIISLAKRAEPVMGGRVLMQMEKQEHKSKRRAVLSGLTGKLFRERYASMIEKATDQLLAVIEPIDNMLSYLFHHLLEMPRQLNLILDRLDELKCTPIFSLQEEGLYIRGSSALPLVCRSLGSRNNSSDAVHGVLS